MSVADALAVVALTVAAVWVTGSAVARTSAPPGRILAGVVAMVAVGWACMLTSTLGLAVLSAQTGLRIATPVAVLVLLAVRRPRLIPPRPNLTAVAALAVSGLVLWPSVTAPENLIRGADAGWHSGWTRQLMGGETSPGGPYGGIPDAYPWLYHALAAWLAQLAPGNLLGGFLAIQVLAVLALGAGTWLLASELGLGAAAAGWSTVLVIGGAGVGWIWQHGPAAVLTLRYGLGTYHGDFILPNAMSTGLGSLAPLLPREAALALLPGVLFLAVRATTAGSARPALLAGAVAGFALVLGPVEGSLTIASVVAITIATRSWRLLLVLPVALAVVSVWLVPLGLSYHRHGGLKATTTQVAPDPTVAQAAVALGMVVPLAALGLVLLQRRGMLRRELVAIAAVALVACAGGIVAGSGHIVLGTPAIVHWLRYIPVLAIALILPAGYAAATVVAAAARRALPLGIVLAAAIAAATVGSTGLASAAIRDLPNDPGLACARPLPFGPDTTVAVSSGQTFYTSDIGFWLFSSTGTRLLWLPPRLARIPFTRLPAGVQPQALRRHEQLVIAHGGEPPVGVQWVVTNRPAVQLPRNLRPYAWCVWRRHIPLRVFRVEPPT
ncbi:MAG TPA: hypothetical protein VGI72_12340 [Gaiellales bacterium]